MTGIFISFLISAAASVSANFCVITYANGSTVARSKRRQQSQTTIVTKNPEVAASGFFVNNDDEIHTYLIYDIIIPHKIIFVNTRKKYSRDYLISSTLPRMGIPFLTPLLAFTAFIIAKTKVAIPTTMQTICPRIGMILTTVDAI